MIFVPHGHGHVPSARAHELGSRLREAIDGYRREHPDLSALEIRQALEIARAAGPGAGAPVAAAAVAAGLLLLAGLAFVLFHGGAPPPQGIPLILVAGLGILLFAVVVALRRR